jgi:hypothetical protein
MVMKQHSLRRQLAFRANDTKRREGNENAPNYELDMRCHGGGHGQYLSAYKGSNLAAYKDPKIQKRDVNHASGIAYRLDRLNNQEVNRSIRC